MAAVPPLLCCAYLFTLALSALRPPRFAASRSGHRLAVLIPAHNEELLVARCVRSLLTQTWPERQRRVIVIADNCSDSTARVAREAGAEVWQRTDPDAPGKGRALRWAIDRLLAEPSPGGGRSPTSVRGPYRGRRGRSAATPRHRPRGPLGRWSRCSCQRSRSRAAVAPAKSGSGANARSARPAALRCARV